MTCHICASASLPKCPQTLISGPEAEGGAQVDEERDQQLSQLREDMTERLALNRQRLEEEHANLLETQAQVSHTAMHTDIPYMGLQSAQVTQNPGLASLPFRTFCSILLLAYPFCEVLIAMCTQPLVPKLAKDKSVPYQVIPKSSRMRKEKLGPCYLCSMLQFIQTYQHQPSALIAHGSRTLVKLFTPRPRQLTAYSLV